MTHDYKRNGTATLFAALNTLDGTVIGLCQERHRHQEWIYFLRRVNDATPENKQPHLIVDNYAAHKHPAFQRWLKRHPRFQMHFTPTSASWLNGFFAILPRTVFDVEFFAIFSFSLFKACSHYA